MLAPIRFRAEPFVGRATLWAFWGKGNSQNGRVPLGPPNSMYLRDEERIGALVELIAAERDPEKVKVLASELERLLSVAFDRTASIEFPKSPQ